MPTHLYTASVHVTGGRGGVGKTTDGKFEVNLKAPVEMGGPGEGANPEQLFAIGWSACFESTLRAQARRKQLDPKGTEIASKLSLTRLDEGGNRLGMVMDITMPGIEDAAAAVELVQASHQACTYSVATRGNVDVTFTINGNAVPLD